MRFVSDYVWIVYFRIMFDGDLYVLEEFYIIGVYGSNFCISNNFCSWIFFGCDEGRWCWVSVGGEYY